MEQGPSYNTNIFKENKRTDPKLWRDKFVGYYELGDCQGCYSTKNRFLAFFLEHWRRGKEGEGVEEEEKKEDEEEAIDEEKKRKRVRG